MKKPRRAKDTDFTDTLYMVRSAPWAVAFAVLAFGAAMGVAHKPWYVALLAAVVVFLVILFMPTVIANKTGDAGAAIYTPSGHSTPPVREYSLAESLVAGGKYEDAADAYQLLADDYPHDPEPPLRYARLLRDKMMRFEDAAAWFKRALKAEDIQEATEVATTRELIELHTHKLRTPAQALPYLARLQEKYPANPAAAWAHQEYLAIKQSMLEERDG